MLTSKQRAYLRSLAVNEDTILMMGKSGMSPELVKQADDALEKRELIKGRVLPESSPMTSREAAEAIAQETGSDVVQVIGSRFVLYRKKKRTQRSSCPGDRRPTMKNRHLRGHLQPHPQRAPAHCGGVPPGPGAGPGAAHPHPGAAPQGRPRLGQRPGPLRHVPVSDSGKALAGALGY